ncbi:MAG: VirD4-like conjugal transfer protein, CD1115 family [Candidatus Fimenecus sp.]
MTLLSKKARNRPLYIAYAIMAVFVIYFAIAIAPYAQDGLPELIANFKNISFTPANLIWAEYTLPTILVCLAIYTLAGLILFSMKRRTHRSGVENGSADYADIRAMRKEFNSKSPERIVYTKNFALSVAQEDVYKHNRNYNTIIIGGPGSRKTTGFVYPNLLEASANYIVLDPKGEVCRNTAKYMQKHGYTVKVLNLKHPKCSWRYNPFTYINPNQAEDDIQKIVTAIYKATTAPNSQTLDPFWDEAGKMLLSALMYLLYYFGSPEEKNFPYLMNLIRAGRIENSEDDTAKSPLDLLFEGIEQYYPDHICVRYYKNATSGAGKTLQSVQITLLARLQKFEIASVADMMSGDELELEKLASEKMALYCVIPDNDTSYNFIIAILYIQIFQVLYDIADDKYEGRLPRFVHFIMDEFANVHVPDDFVHILGTCRGRNIGCSIILQTLAQLKEKYKEGWENYIGQCDAFFYLGSNGQSNNKYISEELGKETIDTLHFGRRYGMHGDSSKNYQFTGRELLASDEVRQLDYETALLFIKGSPPLADKKINVFKYKKAKDTAIRGNKSMKYDIPLRADRIKAKQTVTAPNEVPSAENIFTATAVGKMKVQPTVEININGTASNIWNVDIAEIVDEYTFDSDEFEEYLNNF